MIDYILNNSTIIEIAWVGPQAFLFLAESYIQNHQKIVGLKELYDSVLSKYDTEVRLSRSLKAQMKQSQLSSEDNEWKLQEEMAHISNLLASERELNSELRLRLAALEDKHSEVETFLMSERGSAVLAMEGDLAVAKLRIAELEAEKDEFELELRRKTSAIAIVDSKENVQQQKVSGAAMSLLGYFN